MELIGKKVIAKKWDREKKDYFDYVSGELVCFGLQVDINSENNSSSSSAIIVDEEGKLYNEFVENVRLDKS